MNPPGRNAHDLGRPSIADPATFADGVPFETFARMRAREGLAWVDEPPLRRLIGSREATFRGSGFWAVTRHADVLAVASDPETYSSERRGAFLPDLVWGRDLEANRQLLINMDGEAHSTARGFLAAAFNCVSAGDVRESVRRHAIAIRNRILEAGRFDIVADVAAELPLLMLCDLLGVPAQDRGLLLAWSNAIVGFDDPDLGGGQIQDYRRGFSEVLAYAHEQIRQKRRHGGQNLIAHLVSTRIDGRSLSDEQLAMLWTMLAISGHESTRHLLSGGLVALIRHREQLEALAQDPRLTTPCATELLRWVTPIMQFRRTATRSVTLGGQEIGEGDKVVMYFISANRDEEVFHRPEQLDITRTPNRHLAFGFGAHVCIGLHLAKLEVALLMDALRPHLLTLELDGRPERLASNFMNGLKSAPARVTADA